MPACWPDRFGIERRQHLRVGNQEIAGPLEIERSASPEGDASANSGGVGGGGAHPVDDKARQRWIRRAEHGAHQQLPGGDPLGDGGSEWQVARLARPSRHR